MDDFKLPENRNEADLALAFLDQLRFDPDSPVPKGLDPGFAETLRRIIRAAPQNTLSEAAKVSIWRKAQLQADITPRPSFSTNGKHKTMIHVSKIEAVPRSVINRHERRIITAGLSTLLAAMLVIAIFGRFYEQQRSGWVVATADVSQSAINSFAYQTTQQSRHLVWSPDGTQFASVEGTAEDQIGLFDHSNKLTKTLIGHSGRINQIMWSPDSKLLASGGDDKSVRFWTATGDPTLILASHTNRVDSVAWSPDGNVLASASSLDGTIRLWTPKGETIRTFRFTPTPADGTTSLYWSPDSKLLAVLYSSGTADLWTLDGKIIASFDTLEMQANGISWSPDSQHLALATVKQGVQIYSAKGESERGLIAQPLPGSLGAIHWSPDGRIIVVSDFAYLLTFWDTKTDIPSTYKLSSSLLDMAWSPDGSLLAVATIQQDFGEIQILNRQLKVEYTSRTSPGVQIAWSPDGQTLLTKLDVQGVKSITLDPQLVQAARKITPIAVALTPPPVSTMTTPEPTQDKPLLLGETAQGELTRGHMEQTFTLNTDFDGQLLVMPQSSDFAISLAPQVVCNNGGGGGGGGGSETGGSPLYKPQIVAVCKDGKVRLVVGSVTGTEIGKFQITAYQVTSEAIQSGKAIEAAIDEKISLHYYTMTGDVGDLINVQFVPSEDQKVLLTLNRIYPYLLPSASHSRLDANLIVREAGEFGLLVSAATPDSDGKFRLTVTRTETPTLTDKPQTVKLNQSKASVAFRIKGSAKPVLLKVKGLGGTVGANLTIQPLATNEPSSDAGWGGSGSGGSGGGGGGQPPPLPPVATLEIGAKSELSYKLTLSPDQSYILFVDRQGGTSDQIDIELAVE